MGFVTVLLSAGTVASRLSPRKMASKPEGVTRTQAQKHIHFNFNILETQNVKTDFFPLQYQPQYSHVPKVKKTLSHEV